MTFDDLNLNTPLLTALDELGYTNPTTIQHKVFPVVMSGRDVCGIAQTGTGKTFAYLLPCLRLWKFSKDKAPQVLIVVFGGLNMLAISVLGEYQGKILEESKRRPKFIRRNIYRKIY